MGKADEFRIRFDHLSMAVNSIDRAMAFFARYFPTYERNQKQSTEQASGGFLWQDFHLGGTALEFIEDLPGQRGFISHFIQRHGEGMHHLAFEVDRLEPLISALKAGGVRIVDEYASEDGSKTAFVSPRAAFGALIQFWQPVDYDLPAAMPPNDGLARFDHVAMAVQDIRAAMDFFCRYFGAQIINEPMPSSSQGNFILGHIDIAGFKMEFLQSPGANTPEDFVGDFIRRHGEGLHHFTLDVKDFDGIQAKLVGGGVRVVGKEINWRGERQFFISPQSAFGTLIQVWEGLSGPGRGDE
jgi:methylmalonyl-CoA/ethylmalonyl-CoA epimerase